MDKHIRVGEEHLGERMIGRVVTYSNKKGLGYIRTQESGDIFLSSYDLGKLEDRIRVGSKLEFTVRKAKGRLLATDVVLLEQYKDGVHKLELPNNNEILIKNIVSFGKGNCVEELNNNGITQSSIKEHGYFRKDFNYIFIETKNDNFRFFDNSAPVTCDGKTDLKEFYAYLLDRLVTI